MATLITIIFFLLAATYSIITPIFESPDELWHYPFVWQLAQTGQLPVQDPARPQLWKQEGSQPPLYYALAALLTAPIPADDLPVLIYRNPHADIGLVTPDGNANIVVHTARESWPWRGAVLAIHVARFFSVLLGTGTLVTIYGMARLIWPNQPKLPLVAMAFVAFNPMFLFISGSVNNDNLITLLASLTLWRLISLVADGKHTKEPSNWQFVVLGLLVGLAALAKVSGLGMLALVGLTLLWWGWRWRRWRIAILGNGLVGLVSLLIAGWWYWRNFLLYGDWTGTETMVAMMGQRPVTPTAGQLLAELPGFLRSFWGLFGYFSVPLPPPIYWALNLMLAVGLIGFLAVAVLGRVGISLAWPQKRILSRLSAAQAVSKGRFWSISCFSTSQSPQLQRSWPILLGWLLIIGAALVQWTLRTPASQGRLLFPAMAAIAILWSAGWTALMPAKLHWLPALAMLTLAAWVPWGVISPAYAKPEPLAVLPASARPLEATFGDSIRLLAYESEVSTVQPGDILPLTLYWSSEESLDRDYTLFIHLLDRQDLIVAQRNLFHGSGLYPTSQWEPNEPFGDTYVLQIPRTAFSPAQTRFEVGLYDHTTGRRLPVSSGGDNLRFGSVEVQPRPGELPNPQALQFEEGIWLAGYDLDRQLVTPGESVQLTLYWRSEATPAHNYKVFVHLVDKAGDRAAQHDSEPQNGAAPTSTWSPGQIIVDEHELTIAADAPAAAYRLVVGLYDGETGQRLRLLHNDGQAVQANSVRLAGIRITSP